MSQEIQFHPTGTNSTMAINKNFPLHIRMWQVHVGKEMNNDVLKRNHTQGTDCEKKTKATMLSTLVDISAVVASEFSVFLFVWCFSRKILSVYFLPALVFAECVFWLNQKLCNRIIALRPQRRTNHQFAENSKQQRKNRRRSRQQDRHKCKIVRKGANILHYSTFHSTFYLLLLFVRRVFSLSLATISLQVAPQQSTTFGRLSPSMANANHIQLRYRCMCVCVCTIDFRFHSCTINFPVSAFFGTLLYYIWVSLPKKTLWPTINSRQPQPLMKRKHPGTRTHYYTIQSTKSTRERVKGKNAPTRRSALHRSAQLTSAVIKYFNYHRRKIIIHYHFKIHGKWQIGERKRRRARSPITRRHTRKPHSFLDCTTVNDSHFNLWNALFFVCSPVGNGHIFIFGRFCCLPTAVFFLNCGTWKFIHEKRLAFFFSHSFNYKIHKSIFFCLSFSRVFQISFGRQPPLLLLLTIIASSQICRCIHTLILMCRAT